jgi:hypothetical protein
MSFHLIKEKKTSILFNSKLLCSVSSSVLQICVPSLLMFDKIFFSLILRINALMFSDVTFQVAIIIDELMIYNNM